MVTVLVRIIYVVNNLPQKQRQRRATAETEIGAAEATAEATAEAAERTAETKAIR